MDPIRNRVKELRQVKASELFANPRNWREHPQAQQAALHGVLKEIGYADALLARELPDGSLELIDGHLRQALSADAVVPVLVVDLDEDEANKLLTVLDPLAAMAQTNQGALESLLQELQTDDAGLQALLTTLAAENHIDLMPGEIGPDPITRLGGDVVPPFGTPGSIPPAQPNAPYNPVLTPETSQAGVTPGQGPHEAARQVY